MAPQSLAMEVQVVFVVSVTFTPPVLGEEKVFSGLIVQLHVQI